MDMNPLTKLESDDRYKKLVRQYESPNLFTVMGNTRREEWHSNFICWLLDPDENHQLGTFPLEKFIELVNQRVSNPDERLETASLKLDKIQMKAEYVTERGRIDIFGENDAFVIVIENKVTAKEHNSQTNRYYEDFKDADKKKCFVYLTAQTYKYEQINEHFTRITYQQFYDAVLSACLRREDITDETRVVLQQYIHAISNPNDFPYICSDQETSQVLYKNHCQAIEEIRSVMSDLERGAHSPECVFFKNNRQYINLILRASNHPIIVPRTTDKPTGEILIRRLIEEGYVLTDDSGDDVTELICKRNNAVYILRFCIENGCYQCYAGYTVNESYDGTETVPALTDDHGEIRLFRTINEAAREVQIAHYTAYNLDISGNPGPSAGLWKFLHAGIKDAEGKTVKEIFSDAESF